LRCIISEYHVVEVQFKDEDILLKTLRDMEYNPEVHQTAKPLHGYRGDEREQKAHIIIPRSQVGRASNDVGFERKDGGFVLHASQFDRSWRTGDKLKRLNMSYSENKIRKTIGGMSKCSIFSRQENPKGQIEIKIRVI
jgi:hypothetical protein